MKFDAVQIVSINQAEKDFKAAAKVADEHGAAVIADDAPKYLLFALTEDEGKLLRNAIVDETAKQIFEKYHRAFEELAK